MPKLGDIVIVKNAPNSNGATEQPAVVNRVWNEDCINVTVLPDCGAPYTLSSVQSMAMFPSTQSPRFVPRDGLPVDATAA